MVMLPYQKQIYRWLFFSNPHLSKYGSKVKEIGTSPVICYIIPVTEPVNRPRIRQHGLPVPDDASLIFEIFVVFAGVTG